MEPSYPQGDFSQVILQAARVTAIKRGFKVPPKSFSVSIRRDLFGEEFPIAINGQPWVSNEDRDLMFITDRYTPRRKLFENPSRTRFLYPPRNIIDYEHLLEPLWCIKDARFEIPDVPLLSQLGIDATLPGVLICPDYKTAEETEVYLKMKAPPRVQPDYSVYATPNGDELFMGVKMR